MVNGAGTVWQQPGPANGKPEIRNVKFADKIDIRLVAAVKVTGSPGMVAAFYAPFFGGKNIPYRQAFAVGIMGTFNLKSGGRYTPQEIVSKVGFIRCKSIVHLHPKSACLKIVFRINTSAEKMTASLLEKATP